MISKAPNVYMYISAMAVAGMLVGGVAAELVDWITKSTTASEVNDQYPNTLSADRSKTVMLACARWPIMSAMVVAFILGGWTYEPGWKLGLGMVFCSVLVVLAFIDVRTRLLPDIITLPFMWLGLLINTFDIWTSCAAAIWGAAIGYLLLWLVHHGFRLVAGKNGMGYGDFKLLSAVGAWLGVYVIPMVMLVACLLGIAIALTTRVAGRGQSDQALPFGPALAGASIMAMIWPDCWLLS